MSCKLRPFRAESLTEELRRRFDIVGFDPRGVARSHPVVCAADLLAKEPDLIIKSQAEFDARLAYNQELRADCRARTGPLYDHVDTGSVVRDVDAIRAAVGDSKLSFYGASYGTLIGQQYAERFPRRVRAVMINSVVDHTLRTGSFLDTEAESAQDAFNEFVSWCERTQSCALHGRDVRAVWSGLLERAGRGELRQPGNPDTPLTQGDLIGTAFGAFYGTAWSQLADFLNALDTGAKAATDLRAELAGKQFATKQAEEVGQYPLQIFCEDYQLPVRDYRQYAALLRRSARIAPDMRYGPAAVQLASACLGQPTPIPNPQHRTRVNGADLAGDTRKPCYSSDHAGQQGFPFGTARGGFGGRPAV